MEDEEDMCVWRYAYISSMERIKGGVNLVWRRLLWLSTHAVMPDAIAEIEQVSQETSKLQSMILALELNISLGLGLICFTICCNTENSPQCGY